MHVLLNDENFAAPGNFFITFFVQVGGHHAKIMKSTKEILWPGVVGTESSALMNKQ